MRDFIISTYEKLLYLTIIIAVVSGFLMGYRVNYSEPNLLAGIIGAVVGFLGSVIAVGLLLTITSIKEALDTQNKELVRIKRSIDEILYQHTQALNKRD